MRRTKFTGETVLELSEDLVAEGRMREVRRKAQLAAARRSLVVLFARTPGDPNEPEMQGRPAHASVTDLVSTYAQAAVVHGRASSEGDYETANIHRGGLGATTFLVGDSLSER
jgi:hypothetical protein